MFLFRIKKKKKITAFKGRHKRSGSSQVGDENQGSCTFQVPDSPPGWGPHLDVAEGPHVVCAWRQVHSQLGLVGSLTLIGRFHLQLQHVIGSNEERGACPVGRKE